MFRARRLYFGRRECYNDGMKQRRLAGWLFGLATVVVLLRLIVAVTKEPVAAHAEAVREMEAVVAGGDGGMSEGMGTEILEEATAEEGLGVVAVAKPEAFVEIEERMEWVPDEPVMTAAELSAEGEGKGGDEGEEIAEEWHFRQTRWGMTREEVKAAEYGLLLYENAQRLVYSTSTLHLPCLLKYSFDGDRLARVHLVFTQALGRDLPLLTQAQAQQRYLFLRGQLRERYGDPLEREFRQPRNVAHLEQKIQKQDEISAQYDAEILETQERLARQREILENRYKNWGNRAELVARGLAIYERDLSDLRKWKQEALETAERSKKSIQSHQVADVEAPLTLYVSRWTAAKGLHHIELRLDLRNRFPVLDIRYQGVNLGVISRKNDEL